jgi:catechol 2,3-dioxygenase-like lactoylglutathione lyase family enzyme
LVHGESAVTAITHQHVGLVVDDVDTAVEFYVGVFGGELLVRPVTMGPPGAAGFMNGPAELDFQVAMVGLPGGAIVEFFCFGGDHVPDWVRPNVGLMPHMGIQVDDVVATLERAETAGGERQWGEVIPFGRAQVMYVRDPFGNTIELIDVSAEDLIADLLELFPEGKP